MPRSARAPDEPAGYDDEPGRRQSNPVFALALAAGGLLVGGIALALFWFAVVLPTADS